jgi:hypothetical protein
MQVRFSLFFFQCKIKRNLNIKYLSINIYKVKEEATRMKIKFYIFFLIISLSLYALNEKVNFITKNKKSTIY